MTPVTMTKLQRLNLQTGAYTTKTDAAYEVLREAILAGVLAPGASVQPKPVAVELDMSVIPVREALRRLEQDGLVTIRPHFGATVRALADEELEETMLMRAALEGLATRLATPTVDDATLARLEDLFDRMDACIAADDPACFGELNREFHLTLYASSRYQRLYHLIESLWDQVPRARTVFSLVPSHMSVSQQGHGRLMEALRSRDGEAAERALHEQKVAVLDVILHAEAGLSKNEQTTTARRRRRTSHGGVLDEG